MSLQKKLKPTLVKSSHPESHQAEIHQLGIQQPEARKRAQQLKP